MKIFLDKWEKSNNSQQRWGHETIFSPAVESSRNWGHDWWQDVKDYSNTFTYNISSGLSGFLVSEGFINMFRVYG